MTEFILSCDICKEKFHLNELEISEIHEGLCCSDWACISDMRESEKEYLKTHEPPRRLIDIMEKYPLIKYLVEKGN